MNLHHPTYDTYKALQTIIQSELARRGMDLHTFAAMSNVPYGTLYAVLHDRQKRDVMLSTVEMLANGLGMTLSELFKEMGR